MMAVFLLLAMTQAATLPPVAPVVPAPAPSQAAPPADWSTLPQLRLKRPAPLPAALSAFVHDEVKAGRCIATQPVAGGHKLHLDLAVLVGDGGVVRRVVPRAIDCPTVEQYASGLLLQIARDNVSATEKGDDTWYRTWFDFTWAE